MRDRSKGLSIGRLDEKAHCSVEGCQVLFQRGYLLGQLDQPGA
ncbi:hypothetical protein [Azospirillum sp. sgz301742]